MGKEKHDWTAVKMRFVHGTESYTDISKALGLPYRTLTERARKEGWSEERKKYRKKVVKKSCNAASSETAKRIRKISREADRLLKTLHKIINNDEQARLVVWVDKETGEPFEKVLKKIDVNEVRTTAAALRDVTTTLNTLTPFSAEQADTHVTITFDSDEGDDFAG